MGHKSLPTIFPPKKFFYPEKFLYPQKIFLPPKIFLPQKIFLTPKKFFAQKFFFIIWKILVQKYEQGEAFLSKKNYLGFPLEKCFRRDFQVNFTRDFLIKNFTRDFL